MSDHGHDSHDHGGHDHGHADEHGHGDHGGHGDDHGQDEHGHGHEHWGDYNAQPPAPSTLPPLTAGHLSVLGVALAVLLAAIVGYSMRLSEARHGGEHEAEAHGESHEGHEKAESKEGEKESKEHK